MVFSETTRPIGIKLVKNGHWMVLYKVFIFIRNHHRNKPIQIASTDLLQLLSFPITVRTKSGQHPNFFILFKSDLSWVFLMEKCLASVCLSVIRKSSHFQLLYNHCMSSHQTYHKCSFSRREESVWTPSKSKVDDMALDW